MAAPSVTYTFSNSTTADATQVNTNFTDLVNSLSDGLKDLTISSLNTATLTVSGAATFNGTVALGNATTDDVTITGYIASDILPKTTGTASLGSATQAWEDIYLDEGATNGGSVYFNAGTTSYIQSNAAGTILTIGGFTSMVPPAAINAAGALTIGTNGSTTALTLSTAQAATFASSVTTSSYYYTKGDGSDTAGSSNTGILFSNTAANRYITQQLDASNNLLIGRYNGSTWATIIKLNQDQSILPSGLLDLSTSTAGQIKFPASQNASADANTLDDYEEGTWTPTLTDLTNNATMGGTNAGTYTKIGNTVHLRMRVEVSSLASTTTSSAAFIKTLPFTVSNANDAYSGCGLGYAINFNMAAAYAVSIYAEANTNQLRLRKWDVSTGTSDLTIAEVSADGTFFVELSYRTT